MVKHIDAVGGRSVRATTGCGSPQNSTSGSSSNGVGSAEPTADPCSLPAAPMDKVNASTFVDDAHRGPLAIAA